MSPPDEVSASLPPLGALTEAWPGGDYPLGPLAGRRVFEQAPQTRSGAADTRPAAGRIAPFDAEQEARVQAALRTQLAIDWPSHAPCADLGLEGLLACLPAQDLVVMAREPTQAAHQARAVYVHVMNASGWCPACALGRGFAALHGPVPAIAPFRTGPQRRALAESLFPRQPRVRFVWSVKPSPALNRAACSRCPHPAQMSDWAAAQQPVLRVERQVVLPVDSRLSAFLIRVTELPIDGLPVHHRRALARAVSSLPAALAAYKGIDVPQALAHLA